MSTGHERLRRQQESREQRQQYSIHTLVHLLVPRRASTSTLTLLKAMTLYYITLQCKIHSVYLSEVLYNNIIITPLQLYISSSTNAMCPHVIVISYLSPNVNYVFYLAFTQDRAETFQVFLKTHLFY